MLTYPIAFASGLPADFSCNFPGTNDYLSRTHTLSNRRRWTFSFWAKRDVTATLHFIISALTSAQGAVIFPSTNTFAYFEFADPSYDARESGGTSGTTSWVHWLVRVNTALGGGENRIRLYKNGAELSMTEFDTKPAFNFQTRIGSGTNHEIGRAVFDGTGDFNGKLYEVCMVDDQSLSPASFYNSAEGTPIMPNIGDWGSGGFWLRFLDPGNLGKDYSGNGNNWTVNGGLSQNASIP